MGPLRGMGSHGLCVVITRLQVSCFCDLPILEGSSVLSIDGQSYNFFVYASKSAGNNTALQ